MGAREHYSVAVALQKQGLLAQLYTDAWLPPKSPSAMVVGRLQPRLLDRYELGVASSAVTHFMGASIWFETQQRLFGGSDDWGRMVARNDWFQAKVEQQLRKRTDEWGRGTRAIVFAYSYAARRIIEFARTQGCLTVLGQIDPGPLEEELVAAEVAFHGGLKPRWNRTPKGYWDNWRAECDSADRIVVNSEWSRQALMKAGINDEKLSVVPLMFNDAECSWRSPRNYPNQFDAKRPLRILFLGALIIRKGIAAALEAARTMTNRPVEFCFVGPAGITPPADLLATGRIRWVGPVRRSQVATYYDYADVFLFPTLSDGFGLTQLEAMTHGIPVIASQHCGDVVIDGVNGLRLKKASAEEIVTAIEACLADPQSLSRWSAHALKRAREFSYTAVLPKLLEVPN